MQNTSQAHTEQSLNGPLVDALRRARQTYIRELDAAHSEYQDRLAPAREQWTRAKRMEADRLADIQKEARERYDLIQAQLFLQYEVKDVKENGEPIL